VTTRDEDSSWEEFIEEGARYLKTAVNGARQRSQVFTPEIVYNLVAMSIEKYVMGFLFQKKLLPENHTLRDLMDALRQASELPDDLYESVTGLDRFQEICSLAAYHREVPDKSDVETFITAGNRIRDFVVDRLPPAIPERSI